MDDFDNYAISMDAECLHQDFDDIDLYGNKLEVNEDDDGFGDNIQFT